MLKVAFVSARNDALEVAKNGLEIVRNDMLCLISVGEHIEAPKEFIGYDHMRIRRKVCPTVPSLEYLCNKFVHIIWKICTLDQSHSCT